MPYTERAWIWRTIQKGNQSKKERAKLQNVKKHKTELLPGPKAVKFPVSIIKSGKKQLLINQLFAEILDAIPRVIFVRHKRTSVS